jgi:hypothetical protein
VSVEPEAASVTEGAFCHDSEPPVTEVGVVGRVRSIHTAPPVGGVTGHADVLPAASVAWNSISV